MRKSKAASRQRTKQQLIRAYSDVSLSAPSPRASKSARGARQQTRASPSQSPRKDAFVNIHSNADFASPVREPELTSSAVKRRNHALLSAAYADDEKLGRRAQLLPHAPLSSATTSVWRVERRQSNARGRRRARPRSRDFVSDA